MSSKEKPEKVLGILNLKHEKNQISLIRSANHFGINKIFIIGDKLKESEKSCTNCHRKMKKRYFEDWSFLSSIQSKNYKLVLLEKTENSIDINNFNFPDRCVIMSGHESEGFSKEFLDAADYIIHIPTIGNQVRCLNTAVAGAIGLYEATKIKK